MTLVIRLIIALIPVVSFSQKPYSDYTVSNAGKTINTEYDEWFPMVLRDGLTLFFSSNRPGGFGDLDIYVCTRKSINGEWSEPKNLGPNINTSAMEHSVTVSQDGHWMVFTSEKKGGYGKADLYVSYRKDPSNPFGWEPTKNAGPVINKKGAWTACALFHQEKNGEKLYFTSNREGGLGEGDSYVTSFKDGNFTNAVSVKGINTTEGEMHFVPDEGFIWTNRKGGIGGDDIWITTKRISEYEWQTPVDLGTNINTSSNEGMPSITNDKSLFVFHSDRPGGAGKYDIYFAKPAK